MARRVQDERPGRSREAEGWIKENVAEQKKRHAAIMQEINEDLAPQRARWYEEFLRIIQIRGFNANGDQRVVIRAADVPRKPNRPDKAVY
jgi:hypothetical protein